CGSSQKACAREPLSGRDQVDTHRFETGCGLILAARCSSATMEVALSIGTAQTGPVNDVAQRLNTKAMRLRHTSVFMVPLCTHALHSD
ncbi:MAG TPA: hypothetical protein VIV60_35130, partial [Polyangiaceae bacterium]